VQEAWHRAFANHVTTSFVDLLRAESPHLLPQIGPDRETERPAVSIPHGTTILALKHRDGVVMAGDRQATEGYQVAHRRIEKVYKADSSSAIAIAGAAGPAVEMVRLFQTELEHYERVEGENLSLEGKANKLAQMIRMNLPAAMQGLVVIPIFAGYDDKADQGRIFMYDVTGGRYEEQDTYATGSGGKDARNTLRRLYRKDLSREEAVRVALEAILDAAEEDVGTAGPDFVKGIMPSVKIISRGGFEDVPEDEIRRVAEAILNERREASR